MTWRNIRLIFQREIRDQLRDRRTIFMVAVLPFLLYPLVGMTFFQVAQFMGEKPCRVLVIGASRELQPRLFAEAGFAPELFRAPSEARLIEVDFQTLTSAAGTRDAAVAARQMANEVLRSLRYDAVLYFPDDFAARLRQYRQSLQQRLAENRPIGSRLSLTTGNGNSAAAAGSGEVAQRPAETAEITRGSPVHATATVKRDPKTQHVQGGSPGEISGNGRLDPPTIPSPAVYYSTASDRSQAAYARVLEVLSRWLKRVGEENLQQVGLPPEVAAPFAIEGYDAAEATGFEGAATWAKIFPVLLVVWALTGAFYPAVDLCAGEKERGTLETLLSSPARRGEIVLGKLAAITLFSMVTAVLNLLSMGLTGWLAFGHLPEFAAPPVSSVIWLVVALLPTSLMFSSLALGIAAFARSSKEGQYYLMPLLIGTLPLVGVPIARGLELDLGRAVVPVMGLVLLLKVAIEGQIAEAARYVLPVAGVTLGCCYFAVRWAVQQFNSEDVLFRETERFELAAWLRHVLRQRPVPTAMAALVCALLILLARFVLSQVLTRFWGALNLPQQAVVSQLVVVLIPALTMTFLFARDVRQTLLLRLPSWKALLGAVALAVLLHPAFFWFEHAVVEVYPLDPALGEYLQQIISDRQDLGTLLLVLALLPAICEELAYRGFILSGLRSQLRASHAVLFSALFFALGHSIVQQSVVAFAAGLILGILALRTGSLLPCVAYHLVHNGLGVLEGQLSQTVFFQSPGLQSLMVWTEQGAAFRTSVIVFGLLAAGIVLNWMTPLAELKDTWLGGPEEDASDG